MKAFSYPISILLTASFCLVLMGCSQKDKKAADNGLKPESDGAYHVRPGESIQAAIEAAAADPKHKTIKVHEGTYFPTSAGQAFIWLNKKHDQQLKSGVSV